MFGLKRHPSVAAPGGGRGGWTSRALAVATATVVGAVGWLVAVPGFGVTLRVPMAGHPSMAIGLPQVILTAVVVALAGWALLTILEARTPRARTIWTRVASAVLVLSYAAPLTAGAALSTTAVLMVLHSIVGLTLIAGLRHTVEALPEALSREGRQPSVAG